MYTSLFSWFRVIHICHPYESCHSKHARTPSILERSRCMYHMLKDKINICRTESTWLTFPKTPSNKHVPIVLCSIVRVNIRS